MFPDLPRFSKLLLFRALQRLGRTKSEMRLLSSVLLLLGGVTAVASLALPINSGNMDNGGCMSVSIWSVVF
jgi:hypothetical protein